MFYEEAQKIIDENPSGVKWRDNDITSTIVHLHQLSQNLRLNRQKEAVYSFQVDDLNPFDTEPCHDAHRLIEEFMILANRGIAEFLIGKFSECTPFRCQLPPLADDVNCWLEKNGDTALSLSHSIFVSSVVCFR